MYKLLESIYDTEVKKVDTSSPKGYLHVDLYTGESKLVNKQEASSFVKGLKLVKGAKRIWFGEEYIIVEL